MAKKIPVFLMLLFLSLALPALPAEAREVTARGSGDTREAAVSDALRNAIEQTVGTFVSSETLVREQLLVSDQIYAHSKGFVNGFSVISEQVAMDGRYVVSVKANIDTAPDSALMRELEKLNLIRHLLRDPRIAVTIAEYHAGARIPDAAGETEVIGALIEAGFTRIVDISRVEAVKSGKATRALLDGDRAAASALAAGYGVDYLIVGEAFREYVGNIAGSGIFSCRARIEAKLLKADTGEIIAAKGFLAGGADISRNAAAKAALQNAGKLLGEYMVDKLLPYAGTLDKGLQITITNAYNFSRLSMLESELRKTSGVKEIYIREYNNGVAVIDINYSGSPQSLARILESSSALSLTITAIAGNSIGASVD
ncbi:MAG: LPP20 family lipoprotein [Acidaminococcales bacterium]|nr:LPP20 family lipoprotein [Acidaminococcales bacterium]